MSKTHEKKVWYLRANCFALLLLFLLFGVYLYQVNEVASLEYEFDSKEKELSGLEEEYQALSLKKENWASLAELRDRSEELQMVGISSPDYILPTTREFARRE
jgi:flagellar motility protein MotE (MotC chaperone)